MVALKQAFEMFVGLLTDLWKSGWANFKPAHGYESFMFLFIVSAVSVCLLFFLGLHRHKQGRTAVVLPSVIFSQHKSKFSYLFYSLPLFIFLAGLFLFALALADPISSFVNGVTTYPGKRIILTVDVSGSMSGIFNTKRLKVRGMDRKFYTAVAAAERFVRLRMEGKYHDLVALIIFGNESRVITPFTHDYDTILLSLNLISEPSEWDRFNDGGTFIVNAMRQSVDLLKHFDFLKASGNTIVLFSDGEDSYTKYGGLDLDDVLRDAINNKVPVHFVRINYQDTFNQQYDPIWSGAVEKTGGKFYAAADEDVILRAVKEINEVTTGSIETKRYSSKEPRFQIFLAGAIACWILAFILKSFKQFNKFP